MHGGAQAGGSINVDPRAVEKTVENPEPRLKDDTADIPQFQNEEKVVEIPQLQVVAKMVAFPQLQSIEQFVFPRIQMVRAAQTAESSEAVESGLPCPADSALPMFGTAPVWETLAVGAEYDQPALVLEYAGLVPKATCADAAPDPAVQRV